MPHEPPSLSARNTEPCQHPRCEKNGVFPPFVGDSRPDPKVLTPAERMSEFGRLMLRAIERRRRRIQT